jgi:uncharacterized protein (DUF488 family)
MGINVIGIGYEGLDIQGLLSRLRLREVLTVVDVRLNPVSRKRGMSKNALREALASAGIGYEHIPALGNPRDNREGFADGDGQSGRAARGRFEEILKTAPAKEGLDRILHHAGDGVVALLCFEADQSTCHRQIVLAATKVRELAEA